MKNNKKTILITLVAIVVIVGVSIGSYSYGIYSAMNRKIGGTYVFKYMHTGNKYDKDDLAVRKGNRKAGDTYNPDDNTITVRIKGDNVRLTRHMDAESGGLSYSYKLSKDRTKLIGTDYKVDIQDDMLLISGPYSGFQFIKQTGKD